MCLLPKLVPWSEPQLCKRALPRNKDFCATNILLYNIRWLEVQRPFRGPNSSWRSFRPFEFVFWGLRALKPCDPCPSLQTFCQLFKDLPKKVKNPQKRIKFWNFSINPIFHKTFDIFPKKGMKKDYLGGILGVGFISANTLGGGASINMSLL